MIDPLIVLAHWQSDQGCLSVKGNLLQNLVEVVAAQAGCTMHEVDQSLSEGWPDQHRVCWWSAHFA